jgi:DNA-binding transcriptional regulator GbsR (MarR family)
MRARGLSLGEIARELQISEASISLDMQHIEKHSIIISKKETCHAYSVEKGELNQLGNIHH